MSPASTSSLSRIVRGLADREVVRLMILLSLTAFVADWASKTWALGRVGDAIIPLGAVTLGVFRNEGFAFSAGHGEISIAVVAIVRLVAIAGLILLSRKLAPLLSRRSAYGVALVVAGGVGNLSDLLFRGAVVDFIGAGPFEFGGPGAPLEMHIVFNTADVFILVGVGMMAPCIHRGAKVLQTRLAAWERRMIGKVVGPSR